MKKLISFIVAMAMVIGILIFVVADVNHGHGPGHHGDEHGEHGEHTEHTEHGEGHGDEHGEHGEEHGEEGHNEEEHH